MEIESKVISYRYAAGIDAAASSGTVGGPIDTIHLTFTRAQAAALLACAEVGFDGAEDAGVPEGLCDSASVALGALRGALALLDPEPSREIVDPSACPCGDPSCGGCGLS